MDILDEMYMEKKWEVKTNFSSFLCFYSDRIENKNHGKKLRRAKAYYNHHQGNEWKNDCPFKSFEENAADETTFWELERKRNERVLNEKSVHSS